MPNIKSAKKRVKVISTKTMQNRAVNSQLKTEIKKANAAIEAMRRTRPMRCVLP